MSFFKMTSGYKEKKCNSICINFENLRVCQKMNIKNYLGEERAMFLIKRFLEKATR